MAMKKVIAMAARMMATVDGNKWGKGKGSKSNTYRKEEGNGNDGKIDGNSTEEGKGLDGKRFGNGD
jgi:hypothetical protein